MAVNLTTIDGTDSLSASRVIINDNFSELANSLNSILSLLDPTTGIMNTASLANSQFIARQFVATTNGITVQGGNLLLLAGNNLTMNNGNINLLVGNIVMSNGHLSVKGNITQDGGKMIETTNSIQLANYASATYNLASITARNLKVFSANANSDLFMPSSTTINDLYIFNANLSFNINFNVGEFGNGDASTQKIAMAEKSSILLKFVDGKWWIFGGQNYSIV